MRHPFAMAIGPAWSWLAGDAMVTLIHPSGLHMCIPTAYLLEHAAEVALWDEMAAQMAALMEAGETGRLVFAQIEREG